MALELDRLDVVAAAGFGGLILTSTAVDLEGVVLMAATSGFTLSLATWRLYGGRPWEALSWLCWTGAAVAGVVVPGGALFLLAFFGPILLGLGLLFASRADLLPNVWRVGTDSQ